jgi:hypothetical protein
LKKQIHTFSIVFMLLVFMTTIVNKRTTEPEGSTSGGLLPHDIRGDDVVKFLEDGSDLTNVEFVVDSSSVFRLIESKGLLYMVTHIILTEDLVSECLGDIAMCVGLKKITSKFTSKLDKLSQSDLEHMCGKRGFRADAITLQQMFPSLELVDLSWTFIENADLLTGIPTVMLRGCAFLKNVESLGECHEVDLTKCTNVKDVSALGGVHTLFLTGCYQINDVSTLEHVHVLYLIDCRKVTDIDCLGDVDALYISDCCKISENCTLTNVRIVGLEVLYKLTRVKQCRLHDGV